MPKYKLYLSVQQVTFVLNFILNLLLQQLASDNFLPVKLTFYGKVLKSEHIWNF